MFILVLGIVGPSAIARAEGPNAVQNLAGCTTNTLDANDDDSTDAVSLPFQINFFGNTYSQIFVNNNGNVTFDEALGDYTPFDFTITGTPMIAPFLADVDTTGDGSSEVTYGNTTVGGQDAFCVNWVNVGYFGGHTDKLLSAQLLLIKVGTTGDFDIQINYDKVQWETGDADDGQGGLGGTSAAAGWASGDGEHQYVNAGSFTNGALLDSNASTGLIHGMLDSGGQLGRYVFQVRNAATGPALLGHVDDGNGGDVVNAPVEICPTGGGACRVRNTNQSGDYRASSLPAGTYDLTVHPPADGTGSNGTPSRDTATMGTSDTTKNLTLGPPADPPPAGTTITNIDQTPDGLPIAFWEDPLTLETTACNGAAVTYSMDLDGQANVRSGSLAEGPAGHYSATVAALAPEHGDGIITIHVDCPGATDPPDIVFGIYIDPSGKVRNEAGAPIDGATVILLRSSDPAGPFLPVPDGSAVMSPSNRNNPDVTRADGRFGWDVVAGYYKVRASKDGCVDNATRTAPFAESAVLTIPPPVTDLDLRLYCPPQSAGNGNNNNAGGGGGGGGGQNPPAAKIASVGKPSAKGSNVKVKVTCAKSASGTCRGSIAVTTKVKGKKKKARKSAKAKTVVIGRAKFSGIKAGKSKVVTVKLNKAGKKLAKKGKVKSKVTVKVKDSAGTPTTATKSVTVPKAKARKKKH